MRIDRKKLELNMTRKMAQDKMDSLFCNQYIITKWNGLNDKYIDKKNQLVRIEINKMHKYL